MTDDPVAPRRDLTARHLMGDPPYAPLEGRVKAAMRMVNRRADRMGRKRRHAPLPIHGHRDGFGKINRSPSLGTDFRVCQKLWRLAGVDQLHVNGLPSKFREPDDSVGASARACMAPFAGTRPVMPLFSSGQTASQPPGPKAAVEGVPLGRYAEDHPAPRWRSTSAANSGSRRLRSRASGAENSPTAQGRSSSQPG